MRAAAHLTGQLDYIDNHQVGDEQAFGAALRIKLPDLKLVDSESGSTHSGRPSPRGGRPTTET